MKYEIYISESFKKLFRNETLEWRRVSVVVAGGIESITSMPGHKYYLPNNTEPREVGVKQEHESYTGLSEKWVSASKLKAGDKVLLSNGEHGIIQSVKVEELSSPERTYNLEVEDFHTYYVGENSVYVHNKNCGANEQWVDPYDEAKQIADQHVGPNAFNYKDTNIKVSSNGLKTARYDIDPTSNHVQRKGPHINLETYEKPFGTSNQKPLTNIHLRWRK